MSGIPNNYLSYILDTYIYIYIYLSIYLNIYIDLYIGLPNNDSQSLDRFNSKSE